MKILGGFLLLCAALAIGHIPPEATPRTLPEWIKANSDPFTSTDKFIKSLAEKYGSPSDPAAIYSVAKTEAGVTRRVILVEWKSGYRFLYVVDESKVGGGISAYEESPNGMFLRAGHTMNNKPPPGNTDADRKQFEQQQEFWQKAMKPDK